MELLLLLLLLSTHTGFEVRGPKCEADDLLVPRYMKRGPMHILAVYMFMTWTVAHISLRRCQLRIRHLIVCKL